MSIWAEAVEERKEKQGEKLKRKVGEKVLRSRIAGVGVGCVSIRFRMTWMTLLPPRILAKADQQGKKEQSNEQIMGIRMADAQ